LNSAYSGIIIIIEKQIGKLVRNVGLTASGFYFFMVLERFREYGHEGVGISVTLWRRFL